MTLSKPNEISSSQEEVWTWKESIHQEIKDMEISIGLRFILEKAQKTMDKQLIQKDNSVYAA
jgi:hypothetical protein